MKSFRLVSHVLILMSMWLMTILPLWSGLTFILESMFLDHEGTFNYEVEENTVITNITTSFQLTSVDPVQLTHTAGDDIITVPTFDGISQGYGFPNISFAYIATQQYIHTQIDVDSSTVAVNLQCTVQTQTRAMLLAAKYGYLTATVECDGLSTREYFIHAARLLPKDPFGSEKVLNRFIDSSTLAHLGEPAKIGIKNKVSDNDQLDGFVLVDLDVYSAYSASDPACKHNLGAFGAKKTFCPVSCSKEEGVSFATWDQTILQDISYSHSLRSFHKVNNFFLGSIYSSDSCGAGRSIGIDPVRPVGLANRPRFHVGCEEIYAEHWIILILVLILLTVMTFGSLPYALALLQTTTSWFKTQILANVDFASAMANQPIFYIPLCLVSLRETAVIHALAIATAINGASWVTIMFSVSHSLPVWAFTWIVSITAPRFRASLKGITIGKSRIQLKPTAGSLTGIYSFCYFFWLTNSSENLRNLYLGGYPVVQSLQLVSGGSESVDALRNIGMYEKWTSLGVYQFIGKPESKIYLLIIAWVSLSLLVSIRIKDNKQILREANRNAIVPGQDDVEKDSNGWIRREIITSSYDKSLDHRQHQTGDGFYGDISRDIRMVKGIKFSTMNGQVNDAMFVFGRALVDRTGALCCILAHKFGMSFMLKYVTVYGHVSGTTVKSTSVSSSGRSDEDDITSKLTLTNLS